MNQNLDARIRKSQTAILKAGMELLSHNRDASLTDIAQHAGVGRTTLYRLYDTKEQLIKAVAIHCLEVFDASIKHIEHDAKSGLHAFHLMFKTILPLSAELEFLMRLGDLAENDPELIAIDQKQKDEIAELVEYAKAEGSLAKQIPTLWTVNLVEGLLYSAWLTLGKGTMNHEELADLTFHTFCHGVTREKTKR